MRKILITIAFATFAVPAAAGQSAEPAAATKLAFSTNETKIGTLLDNPVTAAILEKHLPGISSNPQVDMARGMSLRAAQAYAPKQVTDEVLAKIDADFARLAAETE